MKLTLVGALALMAIGCGSDSNSGAFAGATGGSAGAGGSVGGAGGSASGGAAGAGGSTGGVGGNAGSAGTIGGAAGSAGEAPVSSLDDWSGSQDIKATVLWHFGDVADVPDFVAPAPNGGINVARRVFDPFLRQYDATGALSWTELDDFPFFALTQDVITASDGSLLVFGADAHPDDPGCYVNHYAQSGDSLGAGRLASPQNLDWWQDVDVNPEGDSVALFTTESNISVWKYSKTGDVVWQNSMERPVRSTFSSVVAYPNGEALVVTQVVEDEGNVKYLEITKLDAVGQQAWKQKWDTPAEQGAADVVRDGQGGAYIMNFEGRALIRHLDAQGAVLWERDFGDQLTGYGKLLVDDAASPLLIGRGHTSEGPALSNAIFLRLDGQGQVTRRSEFGSGRADSVADAVYTEAGDILLLIHEWSTDAEIKDYEQGPEGTVLKVHLDG